MNTSPTPNTTIAPDELNILLHKQAKPVILDVLPEEAHAVARIPGSSNACVYEVAFSDRVAQQYPDKAKPLVVYGQSDATREADVAAEKLRANGYADVRRLLGGLEAWQAAGFPVETGETAKAPGGPFPFDPSSSIVFWTGSNRFNHHTGTLLLREGSLTMAEGEAVAGDFTLDMASIACTDIADPAANAMLVAHLRHEDFFAVDRFPTARFVLKASHRLEGRTDGTPTHHLRGDFTLRGLTSPIDFEAALHPRVEGGWGLQAHFAIDRTRWNVLYGSGRFFAKLGQHLVNDAIHLHLKLLLNAPS